MGENTLSVKITADIVDLQSKFAVAKAQVSGLTAEMNKLAKQSAAGILDPAGSARLQQVTGDMLHARGEAAQFAKQLNEAGISVGGFASRAKSETGGVAGAFEAMAGKVNAALAFSGVGLAIEGIRKLTEVISEAATRATEIRTMSEVLGVTTTQYQAMQVAAEEAGVTDEQLFRATEKLTQIMTDARNESGGAIEKLKMLGITNEQIRDTTFGAAEMIAFLSSQLNDGRIGAAEMAALSRELGARGAVAAQAIKELGGNTEEWRKKADAVNGLLPPQIEHLHEIGVEFGMIGRIMENTISKTVLWGADSEKAVAAASAMIPGLGALAEAFDLIKPQKIEMPGGPAGGKVHLTGAENTAADQAAQLAATHEGGAAITKDTLDAIRDQIEATKQGSAERLNLVREFYADSLAFYANDASVDKVKEAHRQLVSEEREHGEELKREAEKNASELIAVTREKASEIMAAEGLSKAAQLAAVADLYGQELLEATLTKDKRIEVERSYNESLAALRHEATAEGEAIARSDAETEIAIAKLQIDAKRAQLGAQVQAEQISARQKLEVMQSLTAQEYALDIQARENELAALANQPAEYERALNQIKELKAKQIIDMAALDDQYQRDVAKQLKEQTTLWKTAVGEIESVEGSLVSDLINRRKSMSQSLLALSGELVTKEIANDIKAFTTKTLLTNSAKALEEGGFLYHLLFQGKAAATTTTSQATQTSATIAGNSARDSAQAAAAAASKAISATTGVAQVTSDAAMAAAGAYAATAAIPFVGPVLAPEAAGVAFSDVMAFAPLASLATGAWNIPQEGLYHLHAGEAVAPETFAEGQRRSGGGFGSGGSSTHNYGDIHMSDTNMKRMLSSRAGQRMVFDGIAAAVRRGAR